MSNRDELLEKFRFAYSDELFADLRKEHEKRKFRIKDKTDVNSEVCFVFSCPGQCELIHNQVCQGDTGKNLDILLEILSKKKSDLFPYNTKEKYDILNATDVVHFYELDERTEGTKKEILENRERISSYLMNNKNLKYAILFGNKAQIVEEIFEGIFIVRTRHLGFQSINQITSNLQSETLNLENIDDPSERTKLRLSVIADEILSSMEERK